MRKCKICGKLKFATKLTFNDGTCLCLRDSCIDKFVSQLEIPEVPRGKCSICGKNRIVDVGVWTQETYKICKTCNLVLNRYVFAPDDATYPDVLKQYHYTLLPSGSDFNITYKVNDYLFVDEAKMRWLIPDIHPDIRHLKRATENDIHSFSEIVKYELIEDIDNVIVKSRVGVIGRAVVGGLIAGSVGAAVGAMTAKQEYRSDEYCSSMVLRIYLLNPDKPFEDIVFIKEKTARKSTVYQDAINAANACIMEINKLTHAM